MAKDSHLTGAGMARGYGRIQISAGWLVLGGGSQEWSLSPARGPWRLGAGMEVLDEIGSNLGCSEGDRRFRLVRRGLV